MTDLMKKAIEKLGDPDSECWGWNVYFVEHDENNDYIEVSKDRVFICVREHDSPLVDRIETTFDEAVKFVEEAG